MTQKTGRLTCPKCGANNFETVSACWKCGALLYGSASNPAPVVSNLATQMSYGVERAPGAAYLPPPPQGDPNVASRAAILLAVTIPWIGLPAGWLFMMVEDHKKQRVGRICVTWSLIALVFHIIFTMMLFSVASASMQSFIVPLIKNMSRGSSGGQGGLPGGEP